MKLNLVKLLIVAFIFPVNTMFIHSQESLSKGIKCHMTVTPLNQDVSSASGTTSFDVIADVEWTVISDQTWCTVTPSGTGDGTITAAYQANTGFVPRVATITVTGQVVGDIVVTVTQDEIISISYSGYPWCPSEGVKEVSLSGSSGGTFSALPEGLDIDPITGAISPGSSESGSYTVKYTLEKSEGKRVVEAFADAAIYPGVIPQIYIKWDDVLICSNVGDLFTGYQWFNGTAPITGADAQFYLTSKVPGIYTVEATDRNGCKAMSNELKMGDPISVLIYPNPVKSSFRISFNDVPTGSTCIKIINSSGTEVMNLRTEKSDFEFFEEITTSNLDKGFYVVKIVVSDIYLYMGKILVIK
ncbi:MAG: T9SS type A sorting domain-containing protein [Bacteroidales bacterium]|nr:T9SS type A sorting domain-containing protein [Bacteroidales bacterium]